MGAMVGLNDVALSLDALIWLAIDVEGESGKALSRWLFSRLLDGFFPTCIFGVQEGAFDSILLLNNRRVRNVNNHRRSLSERTIGRFCESKSREAVSG
jgi:hypothetical protein